MMKGIKDEIVSVLKRELEYVDTSYDYSQWVMGVSIRKSAEMESRIECIARTVVKTSESPYVDGMDIKFKAKDHGVEIDPKFYENTPEFQGGEEADAIKWLKQNSEICYLQLDDPYSLERR